MNNNYKTLEFHRINMDSKNKIINRTDIQLAHTSTITQVLTYFFTTLSLSLCYSNAYLCSLPWDHLNSPQSAN